MNPDDLRDHLRTTLEPVRTPFPAVRSLRTALARRRRRHRWVAGVLTVVVVAGGGVGIGLASRGANDTARVIPGSPFPASAVHVVGSTVSVPCSSGSVTLAVGQQLDLICPEATGTGHYIRATGFDASVLTYFSPALSEAGYISAVLLADRVGSTAVTLLAEPECYPAQCTTPSTVVGTITVRVAPRSASASPLPCVNQSATVLVGSDVTIVYCSPGADLASSDPRVASPAPVLPGAETATFHALRAGRAVLTIVPTVGCLPVAGGCPTIRIQLTVVAASGAHGAVSDFPLSVPCEGVTLMTVATTFSLTRCEGKVLSAISSPAGHIDQLGPDDFRALIAGSASIDVDEGTACQTKAGTVCPAIAGTSTIDLQVIAPTDVVAPCTPGSKLSLNVGETLAVVGCQYGASYGSGAVGPVLLSSGVLSSSSSAMHGAYRAERPGTADISVVCMSSSGCHDPHPIVVTVTSP